MVKVRIFHVVIAATLMLGASASHAQPVEPAKPVSKVENFHPDLPRTLPPCGPVFKRQSDNREALCGSSTSTDGVLGVSDQRHGVQGIGGTAGVAGIASSAAGRGVVGENSKGGIAIAGKNQSGAQPAALFTNVHEIGDHIWAGPPDAPVFQVKHDGKVFVQGVQIGLKGDKGDRGQPGEKGDRGPRGDTGPPGPAISPVAVCGQSTSCGCAPTKIVAVTSASMGGVCSAAVGEGPGKFCEYDDRQAQKGPGICCVCLPG